MEAIPQRVQIVRRSRQGRATAASITVFCAFSFWSIWNEPNYGISLAPQATNHDTVEVGAWTYRNLIDSAWSALHSTGHGRDTILMGRPRRGTQSPIGNYSGVKPLRFLRALYCVDSNYRQLSGSAARARGCPTSSRSSATFRSQHPGLFQASGFSDHPYAQGFSPTTMTYACGSGACGSRTRSDPDYADFAVLPRLERTLDRLNRVYGSRTKFPIWSTEYGYWTRPPDKAATISPDTAATYMNEAEYLSWRQSRIHSYAQYLLVDPPEGNFASGLEFADGSHKSTYDAYRIPVFLPSTSGRRGRSLEVWGAVRPAHFVSGRQVAQIQFRAGSQGTWKTVQSLAVRNGRGYFDTRVTFSGGRIGADRLAGSARRPDSQSHRQDHAALARRHRRSPTRIRLATGRALAPTADGKGAERDARQREQHEENEQHRRERRSP